MTATENIFLESAFAATDGLVQLLSLMSEAERRELDKCTSAMLTGNPVSAADCGERVWRTLGAAASVGVRIATVELIQAKYRGTANAD